MTVHELQQLLVWFPPDAAVCVDYDGGRAMFTWKIEVGENDGGAVYIFTSTSWGYPMVGEEDA